MISSQFVSVQFVVCPVQSQFQRWYQVLINYYVLLSPADYEGAIR